jgi:hypothetical protein
MTLDGVPLNLAAQKERRHVISILLGARADKSKAVAFATDHGQSVSCLSSSAAPMAMSGNLVGSPGVETDVGTGTDVSAVADNRKRRRAERMRKQQREQSRICQNAVDEELLPTPETKLEGAIDQPRASSNNDHFSHSDNGYSGTMIGTSRLADDQHYRHVNPHHCGDTNKEEASRSDEGSPDREAVAEYSANKFSAESFSTSFEERKGSFRIGQNHPTPYHTKEFTNEQDPESCTSTQSLEHSGRSDDCSTSRQVPRPHSPSAQKNTEPVVITVQSDDVLGLQSTCLARLWQPDSGLGCSGRTVNPMQNPCTDVPKHYHDHYLKQGKRVEPAVDLWLSQLQIVPIESLYDTQALPSITGGELTPWDQPHKSMAAIEMESIEPPRTAAALAHARRKKSGKTRSTSQKDLPRSHNHDESNFKQRKRPFKPRNLDGDSAVGIEPNLLASNALAEPHTQGVNLLKRIG